MENILNELKEVGFSYYPMSNNFRELLYEAYRKWNYFFLSENKFNSEKNTLVPYGYFSQKFPEGYEMKESFYYHVDSHLLPDEVRETTTALSKELIQLSVLLNESFKFHLGMEKIFNSPRIGNLRVMRYTAFTGEPMSNLMKSMAKNGMTRSPEHTDLNAITLLPPATAPGLELRTNQGKWIEFPENADSILIHIGQEFEKKTSGTYKATIHRVRNPEYNEYHIPRMAMAFFVS